MKRLLLAALPLSLALIGCGEDASPPPPAPAPTETAQATQPAAIPSPATEAAITAADLGAQIKTVASDAFEGRGPGSKGEKVTLAYLQQEFERMGLQPGNGDSWTQDVPMVEVRGEIVEPLTFQVGETAMALKPLEEFVLGSPLLDPEISLSDSEVVFAGYGVVAPEFEWNDYSGIDPKGKTVIVLVNDPGFGNGDESLFKGKAMTYYGRWTYKFEECARQGATACIIVHETAGASYGWEVVRNGWSGPEFDLPRGEGSDPVVPLRGWITRDSAVRLFEAAGLDFEALRQSADTREFQAVAVNAKASGKVKNAVRKADSQNVIGKVVGRTHPDEYIIYTAHWDHLGRTFGTPGDAIFNGAIDNGTGMAALLELAEAFASDPEPPARSVVFLAVTLEESGLLGSRWYAENPIYPLDQTVANINMDALPVIGPTEDVVVVGFGSSELENVLADAAKEQDRVIVQEPTPENGFYFRSDHFNFAKVGVPALYAKGGITHREKGAEYGREMAVDYVTNRYHKPSDEYSADWDLRGMEQDVQLLYAVGKRVADSDGWPQWLEGSEFKARRDAMMAEK